MQELIWVRTLGKKKRQTKRKERELARTPQPPVGRGRVRRMSREQSGRQREDGGTKKKKSQDMKLATWLAFFSKLRCLCRKTETTRKKTGTKQSERATTSGIAENDGGTPPSKNPLRLGKGRQDGLKDRSFKQKNIPPPNCRRG